MIRTGGQLECRQWTVEALSSEKGRGAGQWSSSGLRVEALPETLSAGLVYPVPSSRPLLSSGRPFHCYL